MIKYQSNVGLSEYVSNMVAGKTVELAFTGSSITDAISDRCGDHSRGGAMAFPALGRQIIAIGVYGFGIVLGLRRKIIIIIIAIADRQERQTL